MKNASNKPISAIQDMGYLICKINYKNSKKRVSWLNYIIQNILTGLPQYTITLLFSFIHKIFKIHIYGGGGILARTDILRLQIRLAYFKKMILVITPPEISPQHNKGKKIFAPWRKYYDLDNINIVHYDREFKPISAEKIKIIESNYFLKHTFWRLITERNFKFKSTAQFIKHLFKKQDKSIAICNTSATELRSTIDKEYRYDIHRNNTIYDISIPLSPKLKKIANNVSKKLGHYYVLHIRRTDYLPIIKELEMRTEPQFIISTISPYIPKGSTLYLMSDEKDKTYYTLFKENYNVKFHKDFEELQQLENAKPFDNQALFLVEFEILKHAQLGIPRFGFPYTDEQRAFSKGKNIERPLELRF